MDIIKRKISLKDLGESIFIKIPITQNIDNLGIMTDMPVYAGDVINLDSSGLPLEFMNDNIISGFYKSAGTINYGTDSKLEVVRSYNSNDPYIEGFDIKRDNYDNYLSEPINSVNRVVNINGLEITYVVDAKRDNNIGTTNQSTGLLFVDKPENSIDIPNELDNSITTTRVQYYGEGWNQTNTSKEPLIQEEYLLGIISEPEIKSDVFIDRTTFSVLDNHLRLSEVESLEHLTKYGNGFYNINRD